VSLSWHIEILIERGAPLEPAERQALVDHVDKKRHRLGRHGYRFEIAEGARGDRLVARGELDMPWSLDHRDLPRALEALDELRDLLPGAALYVRDTLQAIHWSEEERGFVIDEPREQEVPRQEPGGSWIAARPPPAVPGVAPDAPADEVVRVGWSLFHSLAGTPAWDAVRARAAEVTDWTPVAQQLVALWRASRNEKQRHALTQAASDQLCAHPLVEALVAGELAAGNREALALAYRCSGPGSLAGIARLAPENVHRRGDPASLPTTILQIARGRTYLIGEVAGALGDDAAGWLVAAALEFGPRAVVRVAGEVGGAAALALLEELVRLPDIRDQALRVLLARDPARGVAALEWLMAGDRGGLMARAVVGELLKEAKDDPELVALSTEIAALRGDDQAIRARLESWSASRGASRWTCEMTASHEDWVTAAAPRLEPFAIRVDDARLAELEAGEKAWLDSVAVARPPRPPTGPSAIEAGPALTLTAWLATGKPNRREAARAVKAAARARDDASLAALIELARSGRQAASADSLRLGAIKALAERADPRARATLCLEIACAEAGSYRHAIADAAAGLATLLGGDALPWIARAALGANPEMLEAMAVAARRLPAGEAGLMRRQLKRFGAEHRSTLAWRAAVEDELGPIAARADAAVAALSAEEVTAIAELRAGTA
jgi:hypothetical protein